MPLTPATRLGPYEIIAPLGAGGMGEVYRARDTRLKRDVAIKVLPTDVASSPERLARFEREARAVAALNHPNIVVLYSIEEAGGIRFLTLELIEGQGLDRHVQTGGLPIARVLDFGIALSDALAAAHDKGVVHRDLKPANVMVTPEGRLKVLDFGLAQVAVSSSASDGSKATMTAPLTMEGVPLGTAPYMAPEQLAGRAVDARADLFALGIILFELVAGRRPFAGATLVELSTAILRDPPPSLASVRVDLPQELIRIVGRCLEKDPERRVQTAKDVRNELDSLRRALESRPADSRTTSDLGSRLSLVVLPFTNVSADAENEYFSDGLTEEVIADLSRIEALRVISRTSAMRLKGTDKNLATLAGELGVLYALEGSVRKSGEDLRITVRLIDTRTDAPLWGDKYSGTVKDVFAIQEKVSRSIAESLRVQLTAKEDRALTARPAPNAYAFDTYLRTRRDIWSFIPERMERAKQELVRALEVVGDDQFLHAGLALVNWQYINGGISGDPKYLEEAERHARKVLELDPTGAHGPRLLGMIRTQHGDIVDWVRLLQRAYEIDPHDPDGAVWTAIGWTYAGHPHRARPIFEKLLSVDPYFDYLLFGLSWDAYFAGDCARAIDYGEQSRRISPDHPGIPMVMAQLIASAGDAERAVRYVDDHAPPAGTHPLTTLAHIVKHALRGESAAADALVTDAWVETVWGDWQYTHLMAQAQAVLGRTDEALRWLKRSTDRGFIHYPFLSERDPLLRSLRGDPRFTELMNGVRARWERFESEVDAPPPTAQEELRDPGRSLEERGAGTAAASGAVTVAELSPQPVPPVRASIAVLPFDNLSGDAEQEYFADGMVEEIITGLSRIKWLFVISRNSSFIYRGKPIDVKVVGRDLGVRYLLQGSVRRAGNHVRVTGQLVDTETAAHVWADRYDGTLVDLFELQDQMTMSVIGAVEPTLRRTEVERVRRARPNNLDAYDRFLRALPFATTAMPGNADKALGYLEEAIRLEPNFAAVHGLLAWCHEQRYLRGGLQAESLRSALVHAHAAIEAGSDDAMALAMGGFVVGILERDFETAVEAIDRSLALSPSSALAFGFSSIIRAYRGDLSVAMKHAEIGIRLGPYDPLIYLPYIGLTLAQFFAGNFVEAATAATRASAANPRFSVPRYLHAAALARLGRLDEAKAMAAVVMELQPGFTIGGLVAGNLAARERMAMLAEALSDAGLPQ